MKRRFLNDQVQRKPARKERRRKLRRRLTATALLRHHAMGEQKVQVLDLSEGGLFARTRHDIPPPVDCVLEVTVFDKTGHTLFGPGGMRVVRRDERGIALQFL